MKQIWKERYQIIKLLGSGGMGQVYKVWDIHLEKEWAMKEMEGDISRELQILKQLSYHRFPRIVDAFLEEERNFLVMDYIQGITLAEILKKGPLEEKRIVALGKQIAQALIYLHERTPTLLYLDLKPSNIILDESEEVKLVDLGSVLLKGRSGTISGTMGFASPEQISAKRCGLNEQSDIFSLGMLLFAMATGKTERLPVVEEGRRYGISVHQYNPLLSLKLEKIIEKCTRGSRDKRYLSVRDVYQQLELWEKCLLKQKKLSFMQQNRSLSFWGREWEQEKSILCTQGKSSLYIAGRNSLLTFLLSLGLGFTVPQGIHLAADFFPASYSLAQENGEQLSVVIRDSKGRKVLVREGGTYETEENLFFEIPWGNLPKDKCEILILCRQEGETEKFFWVHCQKKQDRQTTGFPVY